MKYWWLLLLLILTGQSIGWSQDTLVLSRIENRFLLSGTNFLLQSNSANFHFSEIDTSEWAKTSQSIIDRQGWVKLTLKNDLGYDELVDLNFQSADSIIIYQKKTKGDFPLITGPYTQLSQWLVPEEPGMVPLTITSDETIELYIRLWSDAFRPNPFSNIYIQTRRESLSNMVDTYRNYIGKVEFNGFFLGYVTFAMTFFLLIYIRLREPAFLLYSVYLLGAGVYAIVVKSLPYSLLSRLAYLDYPLTYKLGEPVQYFFFAAYIAFGKALLDIDNRYLGLNRLIKALIWILVIAGFTLLIFNFFHFKYYFQQIAFIYSRIIILPTGLILLVWIAMVVQNRIKWFFITGSSLFFIGGALAVMADPKSRDLFFGYMNINPVVSFKSGILLESLCFALALGYKIKIAQREKERVSENYIEQLELNKIMAASETERLERMVEERTEILLEQTRQIEEQKQAQLQSSFEKQLSEMEMSALRSQMNPHFIFNSLNSIRYQILKKDYDAAATYLTRFSKLLRYILQNSREHVVTLADELDVNRLYVQLEALRFDQGLEFILNISDQVDITEIMIPPMLLQPYIENAVKHGLIPSKKSTKKLTICISESSDGYIFTIEDNGIGRTAAKQHVHMTDKQSLGLKIADERIVLFNRNFEPKITVSISDLYDTFEPRGTLVTFTYKLNL